MVIFSGPFLVLALLFFVSILSVAFLVSWCTVRARNRARLELKRHVQGMEVPWGT